MEPGGSMPHSQGLSNNPSSEPKQPNSSYWYLGISLGSILMLSSHLRLGFPRRLFPVGFSVKILSLPTKNIL